MFLNAVILVLQEILEAALLISVMLVLTTLLQSLWRDAFIIRPLWVAQAIAAGLAGAWLYAALTPTISQWFDYVGLEVVNALIQGVIIAWVLGFCYLVPSRRRFASAASRGMFAALCIIGIVSLGIVREVSEIILYVSGILGQPGNLTPVFLGSLVAGGIGISSGIILFYALLNLPSVWALRISLVLLALFSGNMASQAVLLLTQANWLPFTPELWDTSFAVEEYTVVGQLLYALVGYEANPSVLQAASYLASAVLVMVSPMFRRAWQPGRLTILEGGR